MNGNGFARFTAWIKPWLERLDALSTRERLMLFAAALAAQTAIVVFGIIAPAREQTERARTETAQLEAQIKTLQLALQPPAAAVGQGADAQSVAARYEDLVTHAQPISQTIRRVLQGRQGARLQALTLHAPVPVSAGGEEANPVPETTNPPPSPSQGPMRSESPNSAARNGKSMDETRLPTWYAHGISLRLEGSYAALARAVQQLERLPWLLEWRSVRLDAEAHPRIRMDLELAVISQHAGWSQ